MQVAIIIGRFYPHWGGAEIRIKQVAAALLARGFKFSVLTPRLNRTLPKREMVDGIEIVRLSRGRWLFGIAAKRWLSRNRSRIDLVHTIRVDKFGPIGAWAHRKLGLAHLTDIITNEVIRMINGRKNKYQKWRSIVNGTNRFHCLNQEMVAILEADGIPKSQIWYRPNAVNTSLFTPAVVESVGIGMTVLYCGRLERIKGSDLLLAAWKGLPSDLTNQAKLKIVGTGKWDLRSQTEAAGTANIIFAGALPSNQMAECYRTAQIYIQPSRYEGLPNTVLEAMASGLPVIGTRVGGIPDLIVDGVNGFLVPIEDAAALTAALVKLLQNPELRQSMGRAARHRIEELFSLPAFFDDYQRIYQELETGKTKNR